MRTGNVGRGVGFVPLPTMGRSGIRGAHSPTTSPVVRLNAVLCAAHTTHGGSSVNWALRSLPSMGSPRCEQRLDTAYTVPWCSVTRILFPPTTTTIFPAFASSSSFVPTFVHLSNPQTRDEIKRQAFENSLPPTRTQSPQPSILLDERSVLASDYTVVYPNGHPLILQTFPIQILFPSFLGFTLLPLSPYLTHEIVEILRILFHAGVDSCWVVPSSPRSYGRHAHVQICGAWTVLDGTSTIPEYRVVVIKQMRCDWLCSFNEGGRFAGTRSVVQDDGLIPL